MQDREERLRRGVAAFALFRTQRGIDRALRAGGLEPQIDEFWRSERTETWTVARETLEALLELGVDVCSYDCPEYPAALRSSPTPLPLFFLLGGCRGLEEPAVGMCGSRSASAEALEAARTCGMEVARHGLCVVSGYARGVDTETHLGALKAGGSTTVVLAEGILHFRPKRVFRDLNFSSDRLTVVSQFAPWQRWHVGAAMTRNATIASLGRALVVVEAGETGGTLNAARQALAMRRPVLALEFGTRMTPPGNLTLFEEGAIPIRNRNQLIRVLKHIHETPRDEALVADQLVLL